MAAARQQANKETGGLKRRNDMYFRITGYYPEKNVSFIADSNGKFEKLWQFSAYLKEKGCNIVAVSNIETFLEEGFSPIEENNTQFIIRASYMGTPTWSTKNINGVTYQSIRVHDLEYVPYKTEVIR